MKHLFRKCFFFPQKNYQQGIIFHVNPMTCKNVLAFGLKSDTRPIEFNESKKKSEERRYFASFLSLYVP